jgi:hypothetical protein
MERVATLEEIERSWALIDVVHANEMLDAVRAAEHDARERARQTK